MTKLKVDLIADDSQFKGKLDEAAKEVGNLEQQANKNNQTVEKLVKQLSDASNGTTNYRRKLMDLQRQIQDLTINYRALSAEEKNSQFGREMHAKLMQLTQEAANFKDGIVDAQAAIKALSSDDANIDAMVQGIGMLKSTMQATVSVTSMFTDNNEDLTQAIKMLMTIETTANAVLSVRKTLQTQSIFMLKLKNAQTAIAAAGERLYANAVGKSKTQLIAATAAQKAFNLAAKANPYVLIATALAAAATGIVLYMNHLKTAREEEEKAKKAAEELAKQREKQAEFYRQMGQEVGSLVGKYEQLRQAYKRLSTDAEKLNFIKKHASDFNSLGLSIKSVTDAEDVFSKRTSQFKRAMELRAQYMALNAEKIRVYQEYYQKLLELDVKKPDLINDRDYSQYDENQAKRYGIRSVTQRRKLEVDSWTGQPTYVVDKLTQTELKKLNQGLQNDQKRENEKEIEKLNNTQKEQIATLDRQTTVIENGFNKLGVNGKVNLTDNGNSNDSGSGNSGSTTTKKNEKTNVTVDIDLTGKTPEEVKKEIEDIIKSGKKPSILLEFDKEAANENLDETIEDIQNRHKNEYIEINYQYKENREIENNNIDDQVKSLNQLEEKLSHLQDLLNQIDWTNFAEASELFKKITSDIKLTEDEIKKVKETMNGLSDQKPTKSEQIDEFKETWMEVGGAVDSVVQSFAALNNQSKALQIFSTLSSALVKIVPQVMTAVSAFTALATAEGAADAAKKNWILAITASASIAATLLATIASIKRQTKKYATGGIVGGSQYSGDQVIARVNSGEMILNRTQQNNLFRLLNNSGSGRLGQAELRLRINGADLVGAMRNYEKIQRNR